MSVAKGLDDLWVGVICQTNSVIAGSPRNIFWYSGKVKRRGRALNGYEGEIFHIQSNSEYCVFFLASQSCRAKLVRREGKIPDSHLRSLNRG